MSKADMSKTNSKDKANLIVVGNGMVGHHFVEKAIELGLNEKYDIHKNFSKAEIDEFINDLDCEEFILKNNIQTRYSYVKNENYNVLSFEKDYLKHYTRAIPWKIFSWKYSFQDYEGIVEYLEIEYVNERQEKIKEEIITDKIKQKTSFHFFLLFVIHDLKYGQRLSLHRDYYMKHRSSLKIDVFE